MHCEIEPYIWLPSPWHLSDHCGRCLLLALPSQMWAPVDQLLHVLLNMLSRRNEFQADAFAVELGYAKGLQSGLVKLQLENLGNMVGSKRPWAANIGASSRRSLHITHHHFMSQFCELLAASARDKLDAVFQHPPLRWKSGVCRIWLERIESPARPMTSSLRGATIAWNSRKGPTKRTRFIALEGVGRPKTSVVGGLGQPCTRQLSRVESLPPTTWEDE